jgi:O-methyltransferase involved in polyketide biosynthesis
LIFPELLEEKEKVLKHETPKCNLTRIKLDLADQKTRMELFKKLNSEASKILVMTEGLIIYLTSAQVASFATDLSSQKNFKRWMFDMVSPGTLKNDTGKNGAGAWGQRCRISVCS